MSHPVAVFFRRRWVTVFLRQVIHGRLHMTTEKVGQPGAVQSFKLYERMM